MDYHVNVLNGKYSYLIASKNLEVPSKASTRTSSFSKYNEMKLKTKLAPCLVIINNYEYIDNESISFGSDDRY